MKRMLLHHDQYTDSSDYIKAECTPCAVEVDPEYVYDTFQMLI